MDPGKCRFEGDGQVAGHHRRFGKHLERRRERKGHKGTRFSTTIRRNPHGPMLTTGRNTTRISYFTGASGGSALSFKRSNNGDVGAVPPLVEAPPVRAGRRAGVAGVVAGVVAFSTTVSAALVTSLPV